MYQSLFERHFVIVDVQTMLSTQFGYISNLTTYQNLYSQLQAINNVYCNRILIFSIIIHHVICTKKKICVYCTRTWGNTALLRPPTTTTNHMYVTPCYVIIINCTLNITTSCICNSAVIILHANRI
jgi:hypothetical protein